MLFNSLNTYQRLKKTSMAMPIFQLALSEYAVQAITTVVCPPRGHRHNRGGFYRCSSVK